MDRFIGKVVDKVIGDDDDDAKKQQSQGKFSVQLSWTASLTARPGPSPWEPDLRRDDMMLTCAFLCQQADTNSNSSTLADNSRLAAVTVRNVPYHTYNLYPECFIFT